MNNWESLLDKAIEHKIKSESYLDLAVKSLAIDKGFSSDESLLFSADFASGSETVVKYNYNGELADLDIRIMSGMTKDKILSRLAEDKY